MLKDCVEFAKRCQECQTYAGIQHVPASELHFILKPWPYRGWALDIIGEIHPSSSRGHRFILVGIYDFTKWIEAISLPNVDQETVISFIQNHILYRFGIPETITTYQCSILLDERWLILPLKQVLSYLIRHHFDYAQANGQVRSSQQNYH